MMQTKDSFKDKSNWEKYNSSIQKWKDDLDFYRDELVFLDHLVGKHFLSMMEEDNIDHLQKLAGTVKTLENRREKLDSTVKLENRNLELLIENPFSHDEQEFRSQIRTLEGKITAFVRDFRTTKRAVFDILNDVLESEKLKHLLNA